MCFNPSLTRPQKLTNLSFAVGNFNTNDYAAVAGFTGFAVPFGHWVGGMAGTNGNIRPPARVTAGIIGLMAGFMFAYQSSSARLMGFRSNPVEAKRIPVKK